MFRWKLAAKVFETTARYDAAIAQYLHAERMKAKGEAGKGELPETLQLSLKKAQDLRYGENPHQRAALYGNFFEHFAQLHGKELSYNNILDLTAAAELVNEFEEPTVAIIKHTNPCGVSSATKLIEAWNQAYATDKQAPFGGIIAVNRPLDATVASAIAEIFSEVIVAPEFYRMPSRSCRRRKTCGSSSIYVRLLPVWHSVPSPAGYWPRSAIRDWFRQRT